MTVSTRLRFSVIGAGRVGTVLAVALQQAGHQLIGVTANTGENKLRLRALLPEVPTMAADDLVKSSDLIIFALPDDQLQATINGLSSQGIFKRGQILAHVSGAHALAPFTLPLQHGLSVLAIHPAMTFTGTAMDLPKLQGCPWSVCAPDEETSYIGQALVIELGGEPQVMNQQDRGLYHVALSLVANNMIALVSQATDILRDIGIKRPGKYLHPLLAATLERAAAVADEGLDPVAGLTGPLIRGDVGTIEKHVVALKQYEIEHDRIEYLATYQQLAQVLISRGMRADRLAPTQALELYDALRATNAEE